MLRWNLSASAFCGLGLICCDSLPAQTPTPGVDSIYTGAGGDRFGYRIESADLNADGVDDLVVGAPHQSGGNMVYVFFGPVQLPSGPELPVSAADVEIEGPPGSETGWSLATGDVVAGNEDDLIIGAPVLGGSDGAVHVFAGPIAPGHYTTAMADLTVEGHRRGYAGWAVTAGDFDRDGKDELCVGAPTAGNLGSQVGEVYVMDVDTAIGPKISTSTATCTLLGVGVTGTAMCNGGDINGDGFEDLLVGSYGAAMTSGHSFGGTVHLVYGRSSFRPSYDLKFSVISGIANINGEFDGHNVGYAVAPAGDVNRDGYDDFLIGAPGFLLGSEPGGVEDAGSAYLVLGARDLIGTPQLYGDHRVGTVADLIFVGSGIGSRAGLSVAGAGFCGPTWSRVKSWRAGVPDFGLVLLIGTGVDTVYTYAYRVDHELEQPSVGPPIPIKRRRLLVQLGTTGLGFFTIRGPSGSALGLTVHGPADLDGDGLNDLLLGAPYQLDYLDPAGNGQVHVYRGQ